MATQFVVQKLAELREDDVNSFQSRLLLPVLCVVLQLPLLGGELPTALPQQVGFDPGRIERITEVFTSYVKSGKLPGTVALVARHGRIAYFEANGLKDIESGEPMELDTIFRIYSMTKPITTVGAMILYEEGRFHLNDPISKYIPEFKGLKVLVGDETGGARVVDATRPPTVQDLMRHTAGFTYGVFGDTMVDRMYRDTKLLGEDVSLQDLVVRLADIPLQYQPGTRWHYSVSVDILGYLIEVLSGQTLDEFLRERVFLPLDMNDTAFTVAPEKLSRFSTCYGPNREASNGDGQPLIKPIDQPATSHYARDRKFLSGGGGLVSTARDYARFLQMMLNGGELDGKRILSHKTVEFMTRNHLPSRILDQEPLSGAGFGLGFAVVLDAPQSGVLSSEGEYNWGGYASTEFWVDPKEDLFAILMTQLIPSSTYPLKSDFKVALYQALTD